MTWSCLSLTHTYWIIYMVKACPHVLYSCRDWQIQLHAHAIRFLQFNLKALRGQGFLSIKKSSDKGNVFILRRENNLQIIWIKSEGTARTSGSRLPATFLFRARNFFSRLQAWENNKWRAEFVSARLRKIRYHVLLSVWCQALGVVPECLMPLRLRRRPPGRGRFSQSSRHATATNQHSLPRLHQLCLYLPLIFLSPSLFSPLWLLIKLCNTVLSALSDVSLSACYSAEPSQTREDGLAQSQRPSEPQLDTLFSVFIKSLSMDSDLWSGTCVSVHILLVKCNQRRRQDKLLWVSSWSDVADDMWHLDFLQWEVQFKNGHL